MQRPSLATLLTLSLLWLAACGAPGSQPSQSPAPASSAGVGRVLDILQVENVLRPRGPAFTRQVALLVGDPTDDELERLVLAVGASFAYDSLRADVISFLLEEAPEGAVSSALSWLEAGANAEVRRISDAYEAPMTLQEYTLEFTEEPPSEARVRLVAELASGRAEPEFFVLLQEALSEAAFRVAGALRPATPRFQPLAGDDLQFALESSMGATVIRMLHGYETVPDELVRRATQEYGTASGRWLAESYPLAVAQAIRAAGNRVAMRLGVRS